MKVPSDRIEPTASGVRDGFRLPSRSERVLLGLVHRTGSLTQAEATRLMALTQPTVSRLVASLRDSGMIDVARPATTSRGHPSVTLKLRSGYTYGVGVSLLGDSLSVSVVDFAGVVRWSRTRSMPSMARRPVIAAVTELKSQMLAETAVDPARLFAASVGVSAFFVGEGALMNPPALLDEWALVDIASVLEDALELPVSVDNDGNAACLGEAMLGAGRRFRSFAYFQITNGFGGGVFVDGRPYRGAFGNAGEFAALWQAIGIEHPNLERLRRLLSEEGQHMPTVAAMLAELDCGSRGVRRWLDEAGPAFSLAATAASAVLDCEAVVLGGRIPRDLGQLLAERVVIAGTDRRDRPRPLPQVIPAEASGDVVSTGAALAALWPHFFSDGS